jgi:hypothetical protein
MCDPLNGPFEFATCPAGFLICPGTALGAQATCTALGHIVCEEINKSNQPSGSKPPQSAAQPSKPNYVTFHVQTTNIGLHPGNTHYNLDLQGFLSRLYLQSDYTTLKATGQAKGQFSLYNSNPGDPSNPCRITQEISLPLSLTAKFDRNTNTAKEFIMEQEPTHDVVNNYIPTINSKASGTACTLSPYNLRNSAKLGLAAFFFGSLAVFINGTKKSLKLFKVHENQYTREKTIIFYYGHDEKKLLQHHVEYNEQNLDKHVTVKLGSSNAKVPTPYVKTIREIIQGATP